MRAFTLDSFDTPPRLRDDIPTPAPEPNEVLVSVYASSVNGADVPIAAGMLKDMVEYEFPVTLGRDFAGVVEQVGSAISRYRAGDEVYGFVPHADPTVHKGSWADQVAIREDATARKPGSVDFETAGAAPLAGISSLAALEALELSEGAAVLLPSAAGIKQGDVIVSVAGRPITRSADLPPMGELALDRPGPGRRRGARRTSASRSSTCAA